MAPTGVRAGLEYASASYAGRRRVNEDGFYVAHGRRRNLVVAAVADGTGGLAGGDIASRAALRALRERLRTLRPRSPSVVRKNLARAFADANRAVHESVPGSGDSRAGTTLTVAVVWGDRTIVAHAGDSPAYLVREKSIQRLTRDHNAIAEAVRNGVYTVEQIRERPAAQVNALTRYVGDSQGVEPEFQPPEEGGAIEWSEPGVLLLCTDGVTGSLASPVLSEEQIQREILGRESLQEACESLVRLAYHGGSDDNITVVAVERGRLPRRTAGMEPVRPPLPPETSGPGGAVRAGLSGRIAAATGRQRALIAVFALALAAFVGLGVLLVSRANREPNATEIVGTGTSTPGSQIPASGPAGANGPLGPERPGHPEISIDSPGTVDMDTPIRWRVKDLPPGAVAKFVLNLKPPITGEALVSGDEGNIRKEFLGDPGQTEFSVTLRYFADSSEPFTDCTMKLSIQMQDGSPPKETSFAFRKAK